MIWTLPMVDLNTSHVKVKHGKTNKKGDKQKYLNTSHVKVKLLERLLNIPFILYLNTSHVKVKLEGGLSPLPPH